MNRYILRLFPSATFLLSLVVSVLLLAGVDARAQCTEVVSDLRTPLGITQSNQRNLIVSETGTGESDTGRISIVDRSGNRRTLLDGLPSGINDVGEPSGAAGVFMRGRTLYVAIGVGDVGRTVFLEPPLPPVPVTVVNPDPISSPIFSSVLAIHFSANVEKTPAGFTLTAANQQALANGQKVTLSNGGGNHLTIELVVNFPDYTPNPLPFFAANVRLSNPFDLVVVGDQLYVTDGAQNSVRQVDLGTGAFSTLVTFPTIPNPFTNPTPPPPFLIGGPVVEAVPTGIRYSDGQLLVTLFRGFPFPALSTVEQVDPSTGVSTPLISGRKAAIDVLPIDSGGDTDYLVLQLASAVGPFSFLGGPGLLLHFETPAGPPTTLASCLTNPTSMTLDEKTGTLYITELGPDGSDGSPAGPSRIVSVSIAP